MSDSDKVKATDGIVGKVVDGLIAPVYIDLAQPAAKEIGKATGGLVRLVLSPITALVWGYDKVRHWFETAVEEKLKGIPPEEIVTPNPAVIGPAIEAVKFLEEEEGLRSLFAKLIATSMTRSMKNKVHPGYVEIIKNLSSDDAKILEFLAAGALRLDRVTNNTGFILDTFCYELSYGIQPQNGTLELSIGNLSRLGLITELASDIYYDEETIREIFGESSYYKLGLKDTEYQYTIYITSELGHRFCDVCV